MFDGFALRVIDGKPARAVKQRQRAIDIAVHPHTGLDVVRACVAGWDLQFAALETHTVNLPPAEPGAYWVSASKAPIPREPPEGGWRHLGPVLVFGVRRPLDVACMLTSSLLLSSHGRQDSYAPDVCALVPYCCRHPSASFGEDSGGRLRPPYRSNLGESPGIAGGLPH